MPRLSSLYKLHICLLFLLLITTSSIAQKMPVESEQPIPQPHPLLNEIQAEYGNGQITLDQKILYQVYAGLSLELLPTSYQGIQSDPVKCGVPAIREYHSNREQLSPSTIEEIQTMLQGTTQAQYSYRSPSGKFEIHYDTSGKDAVPAGDTNPANGVPDYVDWTAAAADSSWRHEVQNLGYADPVMGSNPYPIYIENIGSYGFTEYGNRRGLSADTYIVIHNDFENFPENSDPEGNQIGSIKVTVAHELKHAIQYANSEWYGWEEGNAESPHGKSWSEMDATFMEEVVYDNVNDYYNYLSDTSSSIFLSQDHSIPASYNGVTWFIYFWERYGQQFWPKVWQQIQERYVEQKSRSNPNYLTMIEAVTTTLQDEYNVSFEEALTESHLWHYASGERFSTKGYGFEESNMYPDPIRNDSLITPDSLMTQRFIPSVSAKYIRVRKEMDLEGLLQIMADYTNPNTQLGVLGFYNDGSVDQLIQNGTSAGKFKLTTTWDWRDLVEVGIVVVNASNSNSTEYGLTVKSYAPEEVQLTQNYPNPFNPATTIEFALPQQTSVQLNVYDVTGRKIAALKDELLSAGFYKVPFNGGKLASGIYFYRLITDQRVIVKKMTLIK